jgi:hypothetical protein
MVDVAVPIPGKVGLVAHYASGLPFVQKAVGVGITLAKGPLGLFLGSAGKGDLGWWGKLDPSVAMAEMLADVRSWIAHDHSRGNYAHARDVGALTDTALAQDLPLLAAVRGVFRRLHVADLHAWAAKTKVGGTRTAVISGDFDASDQRAFAEFLARVDLAGFLAAHAKSRGADEKKIADAIGDAVFASVIEERVIKGWINIIRGKSMGTSQKFSQRNDVDFARGMTHYLLYKPLRNIAGLTDREYELALRALWSVPMHTGEPTPWALVPNGLKGVHGRMQLSATQLQKDAIDKAIISGVAPRLSPAAEKTVRWMLSDGKTGALTFASLPKASALGLKTNAPATRRKSKAPWIVGGLAAAAVVAAVVLI